MASQPPLQAPGMAGEFSLTVLLSEKHAAEGFQDTRFSPAQLVHPEATAYVRSRREELPVAIWWLGLCTSNACGHGFDPSLGN